MKVVFITRESINSPGARIRCYQTAKILTQQGLNAYVFSTADNLNMPDSTYEHTITLKEKLIANLKTLLYLLKNHYRSIIVINRINYHTPAPFLFCLLTGNKLILDIDDWEINPNLPKGKRKFIKSKALLLTLLVAKRSIFCLAASSYLKRFISKMNPKTVKIPSCVSEENFDADKNESQIKETVNFFWCGSLHKKSNVAEIKQTIECFINIKKDMPFLRLTLIATGKYLTEAKNLSTKDKDITLLEDIPFKDIPTYLKKADIGLLPLFGKTKFNRSKSPVKLFEYMCASLTVIAAKNTEVDEIINHQKNGLIARDPKEFEHLMRLAALDINLRRSLGKEAKKTITNQYNPLLYTQTLKEKLQAL